MGKVQKEVRTVKVDLSPMRVNILRTELAELDIAADELKARREGLMKDIKVVQREQAATIEAIKFGLEESDTVDPETGRHILTRVDADRRRQLEKQNSDLSEREDTLLQKRTLIMHEIKVNVAEREKRRKAIKYKAEEVERECEWRPNFVEGRCELVDPVTDKPIGESRPLSDEERQLSLSPSAMLRKATQAENPAAGWMSADEKAKGIEAFQAEHGTGGATLVRSDLVACGFCGEPVADIDGKLEHHSSPLYQPCYASGLTRVQAAALRVLVSAQASVETDELIQECLEDVRDMQEEDLIEMTRDVDPPAPHREEPEAHADQAAPVDTERMLDLLLQTSPDGSEKLKPGDVGALMRRAAEAGMGTDGDDFRDWLSGQKLPGATRKKLMAWDIKA